MKKTDYPVGKSGAHYMGGKHAYIGKGLVYCKVQDDAAAPVVTYSRVKCKFCGETLQSVHNPARVRKTTGDFRADIAWAYSSGKLDRGLGRRYRASKLPLHLRSYYKEGWDSAARKNPARYYPGGVDIVGDGGRDFGVQVFKGAARLLAGKATRVRADYANPVPSAALLAAQFERKGYDKDRAAARERAERELEQASIFLRGARPSKNPTAARLREAAGALVRERVLTPDTARRAVSEALTYGLDRLPGRHRDLIKTALSYLPRENPPTSDKSPVHIYGETEKIYMKKTRGPYKGKHFVHDFKPGVEQIGFPRNTVIRSPDGRVFKLPKRTVLLRGKKDLWKKFQA